MDLEIKSMCDMTSSELLELLKQSDIAIVTTGSIEMHGPHLPLGADCIQAKEIALRTAQKLLEKGLRVIVAPTIAFSSFNLDRYNSPLSINISWQTSVSLIKDICESLIGIGIKKLVLLTGHIENIPAMQIAAQTISKQDSIEVIVVNWLPIEKSRSGGILQSSNPGREGHGGEAETSRVLASRPELVKLEMAKPFYPIKPTDQNYLGNLDDPLATSKMYLECGYSGNPTIATAEKGNRLYALTVDWLAGLIMSRFGTS